MKQGKEMILVKQGGRRAWVKDPEKIKFYKKLVSEGGVKGFSTEILQVRRI